MRLFITILSVFFCINCHAITEQTKSFAYNEYLNELNTVLDNNELEKHAYMVKTIYKAGDKRMQGTYAMHLISGKVINKDTDNGLKLLIEVAKDGDFASRNWLAKMHEYGHEDISQDINKALYWYNTANSQKDISRIYADGKIVNPSIERVIEYLVLTNTGMAYDTKEESQLIFYHLKLILDSIQSKIIKNIHLEPEEYYAMAIFNKYGFEHIRKDKNKYINYITKSAENNNSFALNNLGLNLCKSDNKEDQKAGLNYLEKAANSEHERLMYDYGITLADSRCGNKKDIPASEKWFLAAVKKGHYVTSSDVFMLYKFNNEQLPAALQKIADQFEKTNSFVSEHKKINFSALKTSLENGEHKNDPFIKYFLGILYKEDQPEKAKKLLTNAFNHGHIKAIAELQKMGNECQSSFDINGITMSLEIVISDYIVNTSDCNNFIKKIKESLQKHSSTAAIKAKKINLISLHEANILPCIYKHEQKCPTYSKIRTVSKKISISVNNRKNIIPGFSRAGKTTKHIDMETIYISWSEVGSQEKRIISEVLNLLN